MKMQSDKIIKEWLNDISRIEIEFDAIDFDMEDGSLDANFNEGLRLLDNLKSSMQSILDTEYTNGGS